MEGAKSPKSCSLEITVEQDIGRARAETRRICDAAGANPFTMQKVATIVSELTRNMVLYASGGVVEIAFASSLPRRIVVRATDRGSGIPNSRRSCRALQEQDGMGRGLLGTKRLADRFDISSDATGTRSSRRWPYERPYRPPLGAHGRRARERRPSGIPHGRPPSSALCGDRRLGHGPDAATASQAGSDLLAVVSLESSVLKIMEGLHDALKGSRGAAATVCVLRGDELEVCAVGNVELRTFDVRVPLVFTAGIVGVRIAKYHTCRTRLTGKGRLVLFSDGISLRTPLEDVRSMAPALLVPRSCGNTAARRRRHRAHRRPGVNGYGRRLSTNTHHRVLDLLLVPLQGDMTDDMASRLVTEVLDRIHKSGSLGLMIDITGLWLVDSHLCSVLSQLASAASLMGARTMISG